MKTVTELPPNSAPTTTPRELKARVVDLAHEVGFDSCRIAACSSPAHAREFGDWLSAGAHGEMNYMARAEEKR